MARSREAVDAAVLAALVRVDRAVERDVGRVVGRDDAARRLLGHDRLEPARRLVERAPAVVEGRDREALEAPRDVRGRAPPPHCGCRAPRLVVHGHPVWRAPDTNTRRKVTPDSTPSAAPAITRNHATGPA